MNNLSDQVNRIVELLVVAGKEQTMVYSELDERIEVVRKSVDEYYSSLSNKIGGVEESVEDLNQKMAHVSSGLFGGSAQEWLKRFPREPRNFDFENRQ